MGDGSLLGDLRALPAPYWVLCAGTFINRFGAFVVTFLALYLRKEGYSPGESGAAIGAFGAGGLIAGALGGYLADRIGRRNTILAATTGGAVSVLLLYYAQGLPWTIAFSAITGIFHAMYHPASNALLADIVPLHLRVRGYAGMRFAVNAGFAFGMAAAGLIARYSYFWLFAGDAATTLAFGVIAWFWLPHGRRTKKEKAGWRPAIESILGNRRFIAVVAATFAIAIVFWQVSTTYGLQVVDAGYTTTVFGFLMSLNGLMIILFELPLTSFTHRRRPRRVMAVGYVVLGCGLAMNAFSNSLAILVVSMVIFTFGEMISLPVASAYIARIAPDEMRGRYMGVQGIAWTGATAVGPVLGLKLYTVNPALVWLSCGALGILAAALLILVTGRLPEEEESFAKMEEAVATEPGSS